jgi:hypothetical protein
MYAHSDSDEIGLFIGATGIIQQAFDLGTDTSTFTVEIGSDDGQAMVVLQSGIRITTFACNDAIVPGSEPVVSQELTATGGTLTFQITPNGEATDWGELPAAGEVMLTGVEFTTAEGDSIVIDSWGFQAPVGWLPG